MSIFSLDTTEKTFLSCGNVEVSSMRSLNPTAYFMSRF